MPVKTFTAVVHKEGNLYVAAYKRPKAAPAVILPGEETSPLFLRTA